MEKDKLNARFTAGMDLHVGDVGKPGPKLNILGIEITPDDSALRGVSNRTGISGKTMLEQMSHQPNLWTMGGVEGVAGSEEASGPEGIPTNLNRKAPDQASLNEAADRSSSWTNQQEKPGSWKPDDPTAYQGSVEE